MKTNELTLEDIGKQLQELQKIAEETNRKLVPYTPPVVIREHCHGHCHQCHPQQYQPWYQPYTIMCQNGFTSLGVSNDSPIGHYS